jgi:catechol 2,3-dioxygenase
MLLDGASDHGVIEALYLRDPEDNGVELYWYLNETDGQARAGELAMHTRLLDLDSLHAEPELDRQP